MRDATVIGDYEWSLEAIEYLYRHVKIDEIYAHLEFFQRHGVPPRSRVRVIGMMSERIEWLPFLADVSSKNTVALEITPDSNLSTHGIVKVCRAFGLSQKVPIVRILGSGHAPVHPCAISCDNGVRACLFSENIYHFN
jgi:hypothetical protein